MSLGNTAGIEAIEQVMLGLWQRDAAQHRIDTTEIMRTLEPHFAKYGYRTHREGEPLHILVMHDSGVGDFINCSPAIREVRRTYPQAQITLVTFSRGRDLAITCPYVDQVLVNARRCNWQDPMALFRWDIAFAQQLLPLHLDLCFNFTTWGSSTLLSYLSGATHRIGYAAETFRSIGPFPAEALQIFLTDRAIQEPRGTHSVYHYLSIVEAVTKRVTENCHPEVWYLGQEKERWQEKLQKFVPPPQTGMPVKWIAVVLGGTDERKQWPPASYRELLQAIRKEETKADVRFLVLGGPENRNDGELLKEGMPEGVIWNLAGQANYRESIAALSCCTCYIGNDTGVMHAAAAVGLPVLVPNCFPADQMPLQKDSNPAAYYPFGVPAVIVLPAHALPECRTSHDAMGCCQDHKTHCIRQITPDWMLEGYHLLKEQVRKGADETVLFYEMDDVHQGRAVVIQRLSDLFPIVEPPKDTERKQKRAD